MRGIRLRSVEAGAARGFSGATAKASHKRETGGLLLLRYLRSYGRLFRSDSISRGAVSLQAGVAGSVLKTAAVAVSLGGGRGGRVMLALPWPRLEGCQQELTYQSCGLSAEPTLQKRRNAWLRPTMPVTPIVPEAVYGAR